MNASLVGFVPTPIKHGHLAPAPAARFKLPSIQEYVVGFAFSEDASKVVLIRKLKPEWQAGLLNGVGGKIEPDEIPVDAMVREFREETGVKTSFFEWENFVVIRGEQAVVHCFTTTLDVTQCRTVEAERVEVVPTYPVPRDIVPNLSWLIPLALEDIAPFTCFGGTGGVH